MSTGVGEADREPEDDRHVECGQIAGAASADEGIDVGEQGGNREHRRESGAGHDGQFPLPREVDDKQWKHEEAGVAVVERHVAADDVFAEQLRHFNRDGDGHGQREDDARFGLRSRRTRLACVSVADDELLP